MSRPALSIVDVRLASSEGAFFYDDQRAIVAGAARDGDFYVDGPLTEGFSAVRVMARALSVGIVDPEGGTHWGDGMSVQYPAVADRDGPFAPEDEAHALRGSARSFLLSRAWTSTRDFDNELDGDSAAGTRELHAGTRYALSQAVARGLAALRRETVAEVLAADYGLSPSGGAIPVHAQSGDNRHAAVDRMILRRVDSLPHGLINNVEKFGREGETFRAYVAWVANRVLELGGDAYRPVLHFDVYGLPGRTLGFSPERLSAYFEQLEQAARGLQLRIESPLHAESREAQIRALAALRGELRKRSSRVEIVADEWCNTLDDVKEFARAGAVDMVQIKMPDLGSLGRSMEAVAACKGAGIRAYLGGSCTETDLSATASAHLALASSADVVLAKPGMGMDEGVTIVRNEQRRALAEMRRNSR